MNAPGDRPVFNDRYEVERRIGRGGMADVFVARDRLLDRSVAIKVLFPEFATDPNFVERFRREAQSAANLNHPNIVSVYDWGKQGNTYFMAMEWVQGRTLADILRANGQLTAHQAAEIAAEVASALGFAHRAGVVHRDIKPANILIADDGRVKVADFGIARALNSAVENDLTQAGAVMGTATYFSPEQAQGGQPDPRSDLYSLGIVLYEMVGGRPPFTGDNPVGIAYRQVHDQPQPLNQLNPDVPRPFEAIVAKLLSKNPNVRYATGDALRDDLRRFREGQPVQALTDLLGPNAGASSAPPPPPNFNPTTAVGATRAMPASDGYGRTTAIPSGASTGRSIAHTPGGGMPRTGGSTGGAPTYYEPQKRTGIYVVIAFLAIAALVAGGIVLFNFLSKEDTPATVVTLEDYRSLTLEEASAQLTAKGVLFDPIAEETDAVADNIVWDQSPGPGTVITKDTRVILKWNPPPQLIDVPEVKGKNFDDAVVALKAAGFDFARLDDVENELTAGLVVQQDPPPGTKLAAGSVITLTVSKGIGTELVPNLERRPTADAKAQLEGKGFVVTVVEEFNDTIPLGQVISTDPAADTALPKKSAIRLIVSKGPTLIEMPAVKGVTRAQAQQSIQAAGLKVIFEEVVVANASDVDKVLAQNPSPGAKIPKGTTVNLTVGKAAPIPVTTTSSTTTTLPPVTAAPTTSSTTTTSTTTPATTTTGP